MAFQKINDNLYLNQALVVSCGVIQKGSKNIYTLKLNSGVDVNLTDICPNNEMAEAIYNQVKAWEGGGGGGPVGPLEDLMYDDTHTLGQVIGDIENDVADKVDATRKVAGVSLEEDTENLEDYTYGTSEHIVPALIDNKVYSIPLNYFGTIESLGSEDPFVIGSMPMVPSETWVPSCDILFVPADNTVVVYLQEDWDNTEHEYTQQYIYRQDGAASYNWYVNNTRVESPIQFTLQLDNIHAGREELAKFYLGAEEEIIEVEQTLKEKVEDFPNWVYDKEAHQRFVYGIKNGQSYKINFDANDYIDIIPELYYGNYIYGYNGSSGGPDSIYPVSFTSMCIGITFAEGENAYYFVPDITDTTNLGAWKKSSSTGAETYTAQELSDVRITIDRSKVSQDYEEFLKEMLFDLQGNPVTEIVDGETYRINFDVHDYMDAINYYYLHSKTDFSDMNLYNGYSSYGSIRFLFSYVSLNSIYMGINGSYYYFYPEIGDNYPGEWFRQNMAKAQYLLPASALENVLLTMDRNQIINERLLRYFITNLDGSAIPEDHWETYYTVETLDDKFKNYRDWTYQSYQETVDGIQAGKTYKVPSVVTREVQEQVMHATGGYNYYMPWYQVNSLWQWYDYSTETDYDFLAFKQNGHYYYYNYVEEQWHKDTSDPSGVWEYDESVLTFTLDSMENVHNKPLFRLVYLNEDDSPIINPQETINIPLGNYYGWIFDTINHNKMTQHLDWDYLTYLIEENDLSGVRIYDDYDNNIGSDIDYMQISVYTDDTPEGYEGTNYYIEVYYWHANERYSSYYKNWRFGKPNPSSHTVQHDPNIWYNTGGVNWYDNELDEFQLIVRDINPNARTFVNSDAIYEIFGGTSREIITLQEKITDIDTNVQELKNKVGQLGGNLINQQYDEWQTLGEKVAALRTWTYEVEPALASFLNPPYFDDILDETSYTGLARIYWDNDNRVGIMLEVNYDDNEVLVDVMLGRDEYICANYDIIDPDSGSTALAGNWYKKWVPGSGGLWPGYNYDLETPASFPLNNDCIEDDAIYSVISEGRAKVTTLDEKINEPLKDKVYESTSDRTAGENYSFKEHISIFSMPRLNTILYNDEDANYGEIYQIEFAPGRFDTLLFAYIKAEPGTIVSNPVYNFDTDEWETPSGQPPYIKFNPNAVNQESANAFYAVIEWTKELTLGQKIESLPTWTYSKKEAELIDGDNYQLPSSYKDEVFTNYTTLFTNEGTQLYGPDLVPQNDADMISLIQVSLGQTVPVVLYGHYDAANDVFTYSGYVHIGDSSVDGWYEFELNNGSFVPVNPPAPTTAPEVESLDITYVKSGYEDVLKVILGLKGEVTTLDNKLSDIKNWVYDKKVIELINGNSYLFKQTIDFGSLDATSSKLLYEDTSVTEERQITDISINNGYILVNIVPEQGTITSPFAYNLASNVWEDDAYQYLPQFTFNASADTVELDYLNQMFVGVGTEDITLKQKFDDLLVSFTQEVLTTDWDDAVASGIGSNYIEPYQYSTILQNDKIIDAIKVEILFSAADSLSGIFAPYVEFDDETGQYAIYATEIPSGSIAIQVNRFKSHTSDNTMYTPTYEAVQSSAVTNSNNNGGSTDPDDPGMIDPGMIDPMPAP